MRPCHKKKKKEENNNNNNTCENWRAKFSGKKEKENRARSKENESNFKETTFSISSELPALFCKRASKKEKIENISLGL